MSIAEEETSLFPVYLDRRQPYSEVVDAGVSFTLALVVETESGCDLSGAPYEILDAEGETIASGELPDLYQITPESEEYDPRHGPVDMRPFATLTLEAPAEIGSFVWTLVIPELEVGEVAHEEAQIEIAFTTREHVASLAVWDTPSPAVAGESFSIKVGVKCSSGCMLSGKTVEIVDAEGAIVGSAALGDEPAPGTTALCWTAVTVAAPAEPGPHRWRARLVEAAHTLPHILPAPAGFSFVVAPKGEHTVSIALVDEGTGEPIPGAVIRMGAYRVTTDAAGEASFALPKGSHTLRVWKDDFQAPDQEHVVEADLALRVAIAIPPPKDPLERYWKHE